MERDCPACGTRIQTNVHPLESAVMIGCFGAFVAFGALFYFFQRDGFLVAALVSLFPAALLPALERAWFRGWPRYRLPPPGA